MKRKISKYRLWNVKRPDLVCEWNELKNKKIKKMQFTWGSHKKVWWKCKKCGCEWRMSFENRCCKNYGCPKCSRKIFRKDHWISINDSKLSSEWHRSKNHPLNPADITCRSHKTVWWKCNKCNFEWKAQIVTRDNGQSKCPHCNSLFGLFPQLKKGWDYNENKGIDPFKINIGTHQVVGWICKKNKNHKWSASPNNRIRNGKIITNCPYCSKTHKKACVDNCLATKDPELSKEWNYNKNSKDLNPNNVVPKSCKNVWWICRYCGHEWHTSVKNRTSGNSCPKCAKILLKNGKLCDSLVEAFFYLKYKKEKLTFKYHGLYPNFGRRKYDFYFPKTNTYTEITGYNPQCKLYKKYIQKINIKRRHVNKVLKANFKFIRYYLTPTDYDYVRKNIKREPIRNKKNEPIYS